MSIWWRMGKSGQVVWLRGRDARAEWPSQITEGEEIEICTGLIKFKIQIQREKESVCENVKRRHNKFRAF